MASSPQTATRQKKPRGQEGKCRFPERGFAGFVAAARNGRGVVFHITEVA